MKKFLSLVLIGTLILSFSACTSLSFVRKKNEPVVYETTQPKPEQSTLELEQQIKTKNQIEKNKESNREKRRN